MSELVKLKVAKSPPNDRNELIARINNSVKPANINWYDYVELKVTKSDKYIVCKLHGDDIPEIKQKDRDPTLIRINEPLRGKLGINTGDLLDWSIKKKTRWLAWCYFIRYHPNDVVKVATWLGIISIIISIVLGSISIAN